MSNFANGSLQKMKLSDGSEGLGGEAKIPRLLEPTKIRLVKVENQRKETSPDYIVETVDVDQEGRGYWAESGAAWEKPLKDGSGSFLSLNIDMADKPAPIYMSAFVADDEDQKEGEGTIYRLTYSRPRPRRERRAEQSGTKLLTNDSIPF